MVKKGLEYNKIWKRKFVSLVFVTVIQFNNQKKGEKLYAAYGKASNALSVQFHQNDASHIDFYMKR